MTLNILAKEIHIGDCEIIFVGDDCSGGNAWWMYGPRGDGFQMNDEIMADFEKHVQKFFDETM